jgi:hypothetical protein
MVPLRELPMILENLIAFDRVAKAPLRTEI